jgi:H+-translocating NAD(P) transhydrogenase subunit alpha
MILGVLKETGTENRVSFLPSEVTALRKLGVEVIIEKGAGDGSFSSDEMYAEVGAKVVARQDVVSDADLLISINRPEYDDIKTFREGQVLITVLNPVENHNWIDKAREHGLTVLGLDLIPRSTRAQSMDILSSMATVSGYKAVLDAASHLPRFFPMFMSSAGTIKPAKVLILGAGVAGLQAIAVARKLGAVVEVSDVRSAVKEEVKSLGARFIEVEGALEDINAGGYAVEQTEAFKRKQQELVQKRAIASDVVIATAQIPGRKAPILIPKETVYSMKPGSVIIDLAASTGGNCELTQNGKIITINGVKIIGKSDYPSDLPVDASKMFGVNVINLIRILITKDGKLVINLDDELINCICAVSNRNYISQKVKKMLNIQ